MKLPSHEEMLATGGYEALDDLMTKLDFTLSNKPGLVMQRQMGRRSATATASHPAEPRVRVAAQTFV